VADQPQSERTSVGFVGKPIEQANRALAPETEQHDPIDRAARELVKALVDTRWSLQAAVVVVALRRLCETVEGEEIDALFPSWQSMERIANPGQRLQPSPTLGPRLPSHARID
jgi:hypothetical protein